MEVKFKFEKKIWNFDLIWGQISHFPLTLQVGLTIVQRYRAACEMCRQITCTMCVNNVLGDLVVRLIMLHSCHPSPEQFAVAERLPDGPRVKSVDPSTKMFLEAHVSNPHK